MHVHAFSNQYVYFVKEKVKHFYLWHRSFNTANCFMHPGLFETLQCNCTSKRQVNVFCKNRFPLSSNYHYNVFTVSTITFPYEDHKGLQFNRCSFYVHLPTAVGFFPHYPLFLTLAAFILALSGLPSCQLPVVFTGWPRLFQPTAGNCTRIVQSQL